MLIAPNGLAAQQTVHKMSRQHVKALIEWEENIRRMGWIPMIVCEQCSTQFLKDGVEAHNDPASDTYSVQCGHQKWVYP